MKKTIKLLTVASAIALFFVTSESKAQDSKAWRLGVAVSPGVSTDDPFGFVLGGEAKLQKDFAGPLSGTLSAGYTNFFLKDKFDLPGNKDYGVIPVKAGLKGFLTKNFYLSGEVGAGFGTNEGAKTSFVWSPSIGWAFRNGLDVGVKYEDYAKDGYPQQVALRLAYGFNLSK
ncbi:hypothetical protein [Arcticibacter sp. MXS-1]|uniref:hypothetical protein n=1 Tax=Arcticibacter sp. MXS-1 TaxID=3341726 RepID=UPI0035A8A7F6